MSGDGWNMLDAFARGLIRSATALPGEVRKVTVKAGKAIQKDARSNFTSQVTQTYLPYYSRSITSEVISSSPAGVTVEIGPDSSMPQGGMGAAIEFGSANHGPITHLFPAADSNEAGWLDDLGEAQIRALEKGLG